MAHTEFHNANNLSVHDSNLFDPYLSSRNTEQSLFPKLRREKRLTANVCNDVIQGKMLQYVTIPCCIFHRIIPR